MKNLLKFSFILIAAFCLFSCSNDNTDVIPEEQSGEMNVALKTSLTAYARNATSTNQAEDVFDNNEDSNGDCFTIDFPYTLTDGQTETVINNQEELDAYMKKIIMMLAFFAAVTTVNAQDFPKADKSPTDIAHYPTNAAKRAFAKTDAQKKALEPKIRVIYARPYKKGREVFGSLLKFGKAWRVGANESTEVLFMTDVMVGGTKVKAGRYSVIIIPNKDSWTLKINSENDGWGNYSYDASKDVASVTVPTQESKKELEQLSVVLYEKSKNVVHLKIGWDKTVAEFPITLK